MTRRDHPAAGDPPPTSKRGRSRRDQVSCGVTGDQEPEVWERQPDETPPAWEAFALYRDLPPNERSIRQVARTLGKSATLMSRWSTRHAWQLRSAAYDREQGRRWQDETLRLRRLSAEQDARLAGAMLNKVVARLQSLDASTLSARDLATWFEVATRVRRLALGEATDRSEVSGPAGGAIPVEKMTPEERRVRLEQLVREGQRRLRVVPPAD